MRTRHTSGFWGPYLQGALWVLVAVPASVGAAPTGPELGLVQACQQALSHNLQLAQQRQQVQSSKGALMLNQAAFDPVLNTSLNTSRKLTPLTAETQQLSGLANLRSQSVAAELGLSKLLRSGIRIAPTLQFNRASDDQSQPIGLNNATLNLQIMFPLARNRGKHLYAVREQAATLDEQAAIHDVHHFMSQVLSTTASAYWRYQGALQTLQAHKDAEQRASDMLESVRAMASVDLIPKVQVQDALSNLSARSVVRMGQERSVAQARQDLALTMGTEAAALTLNVLPADPLPDAGASSSNQLGAVEHYIRLALGNRADLRAAQTRVEQQHVLLDGLRGQQRPQVDLVVGVSYAGAVVGNGVESFVAPLHSPTGPSVTVGLQYQFPHENLEARGAVLQADAALAQQVLRTEDVRRQITSGVIVGLQNLSSATQQLQEAEIGVRAAQAGHEGARERLRFGIGSVMDTLQAEDRHISAVVSRISAQMSLAAAISDLRHATGTFLNPDMPTQNLGRDMFYKPLTTLLESQP
jgi:outer membrane protein TolC